MSGEGLPSTPPHRAQESTRGALDLGRGGHPGTRARWACSSFTKRPAWLNTCRFSCWAEDVSPERHSLISCPPASRCFWTQRLPIQSLQSGFLSSAKVGRAGTWVIKLEKGFQEPIACHTHCQPVFISAFRSTRGPASPPFGVPEAQIPALLLGAPPAGGWLLAFVTLFITIHLIPILRISHLLSSLCSFFLWLYSFLSFYCHIGRFRKEDKHVNLPCLTGNWYSFLAHSFHRRHNEHLSESKNYNNAIFNGWLRFLFVTASHFIWSISHC